MPKINNWAVCDCFCAGLKITNKNLQAMWEYLQQYLESNKEFELRFAIVMLLDYYIREECIDSVLSILDNIQHEGYYVKMAVAWAISVAYVKFPDKTMEYLKKSKLDTFTYNKALQKIRESYRVSDKEKEILQKMKKI